MLLKQIPKSTSEKYQPAATPPEVDFAAKATDAARSPAKLARRESFLTADGQTATALEQEALLGTNDLVEWNFLDRCMCVSRPVCRIMSVSSCQKLSSACAYISPNAAPASVFA